MQQFFGPPFGSIPMQPPVPMQGGFMPQATSMMTQAGSPAFHPMAGAGTQALRGGGLLSRLFGLGGGSAQATGSSFMGGVPTAATSGGLNFTTILTNAQRVLGLTQQVVPMIQQYGPLIRNAPTIWRIMRSNDSTEGANLEPTDSIEPSSMAIQDENENINMSSNVSEKSPSSKSKIEATFLKPKTIQGIPAPKLYI
ncbi:VrrA/YqfQ family protein [Halalkalibacter kiskunsagensis]|uniref:VrrA/YqfQ family protein n=1 Tax=Halalkalibacter kiskunsagensis TaxID=1548599 RepID=A0ABV6KJJ7_9BACI